MNEQNQNVLLPAAAAIPQPCAEIPVSRVRKMVHEAIMAERERCAKIADEWTESVGGQSASEIIAAKIRSGE